MKKLWWMGGLSFACLTGLACTNEPVVVAGNEQALTVDKVDILLVVDDSASMEGLQAELPALLDALVAGSDEPGKERPALTDIHLAVVSTDVGVSTDAQLGIAGCEGFGDDGLFIPVTSEDLEQCAAETPSFLTYDGESSTVATSDTVACIPSLGTQGCGFEQPLESGLKALWPSSDDSIEFLGTGSHGDDENAGFLREDSLLIVVVVTDEDDCSVEDPSLLDLENEELADVGLNLRCPIHTDYLYDVQRYVDGLRNLRAGDNPVLFTVIGGIPPELVDEEALADVDFSDPEEVDAFYDSVLDAPAMQVRVDPDREGPSANILPSCETVTDEMTPNYAYPPRRLVQIAKSFGSAGVLGSVCADDFAPTIANVIRAAADRL